MLRSQSETEERELEAEPSLVGSGESIARCLQEYVDLGIDTFIHSGYPHKEEAERFGKYVMPHFAGRTTTSSATAAA